tara:strand:- start:9823 stop:10113 length:291 start_codon:yes stop_codon:yes gene_type:complete
MKGKPIKRGLSTAAKYQERPMPFEQMTVLERRERHMKNHPNDKNQKRKDKGITWSKKTERDKMLKQFYKTHVYTFVDENDVSKKRWIRIAGYGEEE